MTRTKPHTHAETPDRRAAGAEPAPTRSCAACRACAPRDVLLRFVSSSAGAPDERAAARFGAVADGAAEGVIVLDPTRTRAGRGINLGPSPICLERAIKRGALQRRLRVSISREEGEVIAHATRAALYRRLAGYLTSAHRRGALTPVATLAEVVPREARVLWESAELAEVVGRVPPVRATSPRIAARIKALTCAVSEFTFARASGMKRRPEARDACEALERCWGGAVPGTSDDPSATGGTGPSASGHVLGQVPGDER